MARRLSPALSFAALTLCAGAVMMGSAVRAQTEADPQAQRLRTLEQRLDASLKLIERLTERIAELERAAAQAKPVGAAPAAPEQEKEIAALRENVQKLADGLKRSSSQAGAALHGFADAGAAWSSRDDPARRRGFGVGTLDFYLTPQFGNRVKSLMEIALYYDALGHGEIEAERMQIGYTLDEALTVWAGRFHTPIGMWNTLYHHGANLQTAISRPRFVEFEDREGLVPTHSIGVWGSGKSGLGKGKLTYDVYLSNGPTVRGRTLDYNPFTDDNSGKLLGVNLGYQPNGSLRGLSVGVHGFGSTVDTRLASGALFARTRLRMAGGYLGYDANGWEGLSEYYRFDNTDLASGTRRASNAWFAQLGHTFGSMTPYLRHEKASLDGADNFFITQRGGLSYARSSIGLRYELDANSALKIEFGATSEAAATLIDQNGAPVPMPRVHYRRGAIEYSIAF